MKKVFLLFIGLFFTSIIGFAQVGFEEWDKKYQKVDFLKILDNEQKYADSVEANMGKSEYYTRLDSYRFSAKYLGEKRKVDPGVMRSMKNVMKLLGKPVPLEGLIEHEYLFQLGEVKFWAPIQKQLEKPFMKEVKPGTNSTIYCLFLNEHSSNGLYNTLLVSEFYSE